MLDFIRELKKSAKKVNALLSEVSREQNLPFENLQTFAGVGETFKENVPAYVGENYCRLTVKTEEHLQFVCDIKPGEANAYPTHWHDCLEVCTILEGEMGDLLLRDKKAKAGEKMIYLPFIEHRPCNNTGGELRFIVDFYRLK